MEYQVERNAILSVLPCEVAEEHDCVVEVAANEAGQCGGVLSKHRGTSTARQIMSMRCETLSLSMSMFNLLQTVVDELRLQMIST